MFPAVNLDKTLDVVESLIFDHDKYKQRAGGEILAGILRGKHGTAMVIQRRPN